jgi:hypothetical protein
MFFLHILPEGGTAGKFPISMRRSEDRLEMDIDAWCPIPQKLVAEVTWISTCEWVWPPTKKMIHPQIAYLYTVYLNTVRCWLHLIHFLASLLQYNPFLKIIGKGIALDSSGINVHRP